MSIKTIADFAKLPDLDKLALVEIQPAAQLNEQTWTQCGSPNTNVWYLYPFDDGEVVKVEEDGEEYTEKFSISDCNGTAGTFYYDDLSKILCVHTSGSDSPAAIVSEKPKYSIVAYFWIGFGNRPKIVERFDQLITNKISNFWTTLTNAEDWNEGISGSSTVTRDTTVYDDTIHLYSCKFTIDGSGNQAYVYQTISAKPRRKVKIRVLYKTNAGETGRIYFCDPGFNIYLDSNGSWSDSWAAIILPTSTSWTWFELEFMTHANYSTYRYYVGSGNPNAQVWIQEVNFYRYRQPVYYQPLLPSELPSIQQSVGSYIFPESQISISETKIINDGWWSVLGQGDNISWHNKRTIFRGGSMDWEYEDLPIFFFGLCRKPRFNAHYVTLDVVDDRLELATLPLSKFDSTNYPNVESDYANKPIPIHVGSSGAEYQLPEFQPPQSNTSNYTYKVSEVNFRGTAYSIKDVAYVYKDGVLQTLTTHYTKNLSAGTFTMVSDPGDAIITCKAKGVTGFEPFGTGGGYHAMRPSDLLYFLLCVANNIDKHRINMAAMKDLYDNRSLAGTLHIPSDTDTIDLINTILIYAVCQLYTTMDGTIVMKRYTSTEPDNILMLQTEDIIDWEIEYDTNHTHRYLTMRHLPNYYTGIWKEENEDRTTTEFDPEKITWEHGIDGDRLILDAPINDNQITQLIDSIFLLMENPIKVIKFTTNNHGALLLNPTDKLKLTIHARFDSYDTYPAQEQLVQVYHIDKDLKTGNSYIEAFFDLGPLGFGLT